MGNSNSKHIIFATIGSFGDVHPMIALAIELERRGHRATIVTTEVYRSKIEEIGLGFKPIRPDLSPDDPGLMAKVMEPKKGPEFIIRELFMPRVREMYDDLADAAEDADFIVSGEIVFATKILAEHKNIPWAMAVLQPSSFFSVYDPSVLAPLPFTKYLYDAPTLFHRLLLGLGKRIGRSWGQPVVDLRSELGLPEIRDPLFHDKFSPDLNLAMFSSVLGSPQPDWPVNSKQTGFVYYDKQEHNAEIPAKLADFLDSGEPPIVFTLGSAAVMAAGNFYEESIKAVQNLGKRAVLLVGTNTIEHDLPETFAVFDYIPYSRILPKAACVVHQGGAGTTAQVLRAGVPQLVIPYGFDQPDNAARVERLGVARTIGRNEYTTERAEKMLTELLTNTKYSENAKKVSQIVEAEDGLKDSCDAIEKQLLG